MLVRHSGPWWRPAGLRLETTMTENLTPADVVRGPLFAVHTSPPWLLHLSGELDLDGAPALTVALQGTTRRGGTVGLDLSELTFRDSTGINAIMNIVRLLGEFGRIVLFNPSPTIGRLIEICGLVGIIDISDDLSPGPLHPDSTPRRVGTF